MHARRDRHPFQTLRQYGQAGPRAAVERCELCSVAIPPQHRHLFEVEPRQVLCACPPCAMRFENVVGGRYRLIPRDTRALPNFQMTDAVWEGLALPIDLAFLFESTPAGRVVAMYPSPAGATESALALDAWQTLVADNPPLAHLQADVEALLVNRVGAARAYYLAPIDACFRLVGLIRMHWRGLSGGEAAWAEIRQFFARLDAAAVPVREAHHA